MKKLRGASRSGTAVPVSVACRAGPEAGEPGPAGGALHGGGRRPGDGRLQRRRPPPWTEELHGADGRR